MTIQPDLMMISSDRPAGDARTGAQRRGGRPVRWRSVDDTRTVLHPSPNRLRELQEIVRRAYQAPFRGDLLDASQQELPKASWLLDLSEDRFHDLLA